MEFPLVARSRGRRRLRGRPAQKLRAWSRLGGDHPPAAKIDVDQSVTQHRSVHQHVLWCVGGPRVALDRAVGRYGGPQVAPRFDEVDQHRRPDAPPARGEIADLHHCEADRAERLGEASAAALGSKYLVGSTATSAITAFGLFGLLVVFFAAAGRLLLRRTRNHARPSA